MTNKQIIIGGVDVSWCKYWKGYCVIASLCGYPGHLCEVTYNCYYKQLKRKEQECEELKKKKEENTTFYLKKYANKDSECLELQHKVNILKQTLVEIKEIADYELNNLTDSAIHGGRYLEILDKISEVENE